MNLFGIKQFNAVYVAATSVLPVDDNATRFPQSPVTEYVIMGYDLRAGTPYRPLCLSRDQKQRVRQNVMSTNRTTVSNRLPAAWWHAG